MSNEMIERVAKAICVAQGGEIEEWSEWKTEAACAISAMRDPNLEMISAAYAELFLERVTPIIYDTWRAMVSAASDDGG